MTGDRGWSMLPAAPDAVSPDGSAEIRYLIKTPDGDLTHGVCPAGVVAAVHELPELYEAYYILAGRGEMWRRTPDREGVTPLHPGRWVAMPAGTQFQYRAYDAAALVFAFTVIPSWQPDLFHTIDGGIWPVGKAARLEPTPDGAMLRDWMSGDVATAGAVASIDGSDIRPVAVTSGGVLQLCTLAPDAVSVPVRHRQAHESWYVTAGFGELWRRFSDGQQGVVPLWPGTSVRIPAGSVFQFRSTGAEVLELLRLAMPGDGDGIDAVPASSGVWV